MKPPVSCQLTGAPASMPTKCKAKFPGQQRGVAGLEEAVDGGPVCEGWREGRGGGVRGGFNGCPIVIGTAQREVEGWRGASHGEERVRRLNQG